MAQKWREHQCELVFILAIPVMLLAQKLLEHFIFKGKICIVIQLQNNNSMFCIFKTCMSCIYSYSITFAVKRP